MRIIMSSSGQNEPDLSIYRKGINCYSHVRLTAKILKTWFQFQHDSQWATYELYNARMCSKHVGITNTRQARLKKCVEEQRIVNDLMYEYYQELKNNDKLVFNIDKIDSMNDVTFKIWFSYDKNKFQQICCFIKTCDPKYVVFSASYVRPFLLI